MQTPASAQLSIQPVNIPVELWSRAKYDEDGLGLYPGPP